MKRLVIVFILVSFLFIFLGCDKSQNKTSQTTTTTTITSHQNQQGKKILAEEADSILTDIIELREEKLFLVKLEFKKQQLTLDIFQIAKNAIAAKSETMIVGEETFNSYEIGQKISSVNDVGGFFFNGDFSKYVVRVVDKEIQSQHFWIKKNGVQKEINESLYSDVLNQLKAMGRQVITTPFAGVTRNYILDKSFEEYKIIETKPLSRYFVTVQVENSTFTLDITKHIRNAANTHKITIEVPFEVYQKTGEMWDAKLSTRSFIMTGNLSKLRGKVINKYTKRDDNYKLVKTEEGREFVVPK